MEPHNPYAAPAAALTDTPSPGEQVLADRGMRLVAATIDTILLIAILVPIMFVGGYFTLIMAGQAPGFLTQVTWAAISFGIFALLQGYPLSQAGQTWGKKMMKMKVVDLDGRKPDLVHLLGLRIGTTQLISLVPFLGPFYGIVNVLFIFGEDRRCLHDMIAGTRVVVAD